MPIVRVRMNLKQLQSFVEKISSPGFKYQLHQLADLELQNTLATKVMVNDYSRVYKIKDKAEMKSLIQSKSDPPKATYNQKYLKNKAAGVYYPYTAGLPPHVLTGNLRDSVRFDSTPEKVEMSISMKGGSAKPSLEKLVKDKKTTVGGYKLYITKKLPSVVKVFNYFLKHEQNKSILKSTFVLGWKDIMDSLFGFLVKTARQT